MESLLTCNIHTGSRGDCQPYIALGLELLSRGHEVAIATEERMRPLVQEFGLQFMMIAGDPTGLLLKPESQVC
jgi:sterol 3beta-glucosyltransferase